mgnify:CR=1 FL=1
MPSSRPPADALAPPDGFAPIIHSNPFGAHIGPIYERLEGEDFCRGFFIAEKLTNSAGIAHGGVLMTFADIVLARAVMAEIDAAAVTIRLTCDFIAPAKRDGWVEGRARVTRATKSVVFVEGELSVAGKPNLAAQGLFKPLT